MVTRIAFRVDSGFNMGIGHLGRCLTIAKALRAGAGQDSLFICRSMPGSGEHLIIEAGFQVCHLEAATTFQDVHEGMLHSDFLPCSQREDAIATISALARHAPTVDTVIIDHYGIFKSWDELLYRNYRLYKLDDLADRHHLCHGLMDQNYYLGFEGRYERMVPEDANLLLGPEFALLRPEFSRVSAIKRNPRICLKDILISFGGYDQHGYGLRIAADLLEGTDFNITILGGHPDESNVILHSMQTKYGGRLKIPGYVSDTAGFLLEADLFIGASGSTTWERFACGLPGVVFSTAANQVQLANDLSSRKLQIFAGDIQKYQQKDLFECIRMLTNYEIRSAQVTEMQRLVDGQGVQRLITRWGLL